MRGSALEYKRAFDRIRQLGVSPALFTFDRAPLMGKPNYAEHAQRWICRRSDGSFTEGFRDMGSAGSRHSGCSVAGARSPSQVRSPTV